ncbi:MAG: aldehyde ferredoxin oxidoreductase N-terminal domain-containing protein, partial [Spirochaetaceae bacterium]|nr:aldehyde ferredoxin oxidoreductase N-terminal domain-containing protein [Spirochaetaceae bacterium]
MVEHRGPSHRFLNADLTSRSWSVYSISRSDQNLYLGGKGLGLKIYYDIVGSGNLGAAEPLGPDNLLIFSLGPMLGTGEAQDRLNLGAKEAAAVIGPAGENLVPYAVIRSGHRFAGRGGVGAVMGAKNLKAVAARGKDYRITPADADLFQRTVNRAKTHILRNGMLKDYRAFGTLANVRHGIESDFVPVHNFRDRRHPDTEQISGQAMAARYSTRHSSCRHCTVLCGHKGRYPDGIIRQIPEYETTGMFGSNIGNFNPDLI